MNGHLNRNNRLLQTRLDGIVMQIDNFFNELGKEKHVKL